MVSPCGYFQNGIFHSTVVKKLFNNIVTGCLKKGSVSVMDLGCGSGRVLLNEVIPLLPKDFLEVVGVDKYQSMVEYCRNFNTDPRISFEQLDITTKELPNNLLNRFDLITSVFCLHYVIDYNQAIENIQKMLKPNGELIYIQAYNLNPLYDSYRKLCKIDRWKPLLHEFENYTEYFSRSDRESELENIYRRNGLKLLNYAFTGIKLKLIPIQFEASFAALDSFEEKIPEDLKEIYKKDFHKSFFEVHGWDYANKEELEKEKERSVDCLTVHAQKL